MSLKVFSKVGYEGAAHNTEKLAAKDDLLFTTAEDFLCSSGGSAAAIEIPCEEPKKEVKKPPEKNGIAMGVSAVERGSGQESNKEMARDGKKVRMVSENVIGHLPPLASIRNSRQPDGKKVRSKVMRKESIDRRASKPSQLSVVASANLDGPNSHCNGHSDFALQVSSKPLKPMYRRKFRASVAEKKPGNLVVGGGRKSHSDTSSQHSKRKIVAQVMKARLYFLTQIGPNSFLIGGDSPDHKYRVFIGSQRCSCSASSHCMHILFIMLRVFQLPENDPMIWQKSLRNFEVEALFSQFHERRKHLISSSKPRKAAMLLEPQVVSEEKAEGKKLEKEESEDETNCAICLLEMIEGESLMLCSFCQNRLHHHCVNIWFEECRQQKEKLICPLCRTEWKSEHEDSSSQPDHLQSAEESAASVIFQAARDSQNQLPQAEPIAPEHLDMAEPWIEVLGEDLISCLFSSSWAVREEGLRQLGHRAVGILLLGVGEGRSGVVVSPVRQQTTHSMIDTCCAIFCHCCADPVYKVFVSSLRALQSILEYVPCRDERQQQRLQCALRPVINTILWKCADSNRRTSRLSMSTLQEFVRGQDGDLAVGREIVMPGIHGLGGMEFVLLCVAEDYDKQLVQKQWLLGRLNAIAYLMEENPQQFSTQQSNLDGGSRILSILNFVRPALDHQNQRISLVAQTIFQFLSRLQASNSSMLQEITSRLEGLDLSLQVSLKRKLLHFDSGFQSLEFGEGCELKEELQRAKMADKDMPSDFMQTSKGIGPDFAEATTQTDNEMSDSDENLDEVDVDVILNGRRRNSVNRVNTGMWTSPTLRFGERKDASQDSPTTDEEGIPYRPKLALLASTTCQTDASEPHCSNDDHSDVAEITFRGEVAMQMENDSKRNSCLCQEEVEKEEELAMINAIEKSKLSQNKLPYVPQLSQSMDELSEDSSDNEEGSPYLEGKHWIRGRVIGTGAFSTCYQARDIQTGTIMAVKQISFCRNSLSEQEKVKAVILEEIQMMKRIQHPNIVRILGYKQHNSYFFMFVEWMAGGSVAMLLDSYGSFSERVIVSYTRQTLNALAYLHDNQILHRDLKGANLLVDSTGERVRIGDFGAAARLATRSTMVGELKGQLLGTIAFMAPEVLRGENYGRSCDVWSVGCLMIEMKTTKPPWGASDISNHLALIFKIASTRDPPEIPSDLNPPVQDVMRRCLECKKEDRPTAADLLKHPLFTLVST